MSYYKAKQHARQVVDPDDFPHYLEMVEFCLRHRNKLNEWQNDFIDTREKWERWSGGPTYNMFRKLVEAFLDVGGRPIHVDLPTDNEVAQNSTRND